MIPHLAEGIAWIPDLFNLFFTGVRVNEFSDVSTSQMYDPTQKTWAYGLLQQLGLPTDATGVTVVDIDRDSPAAGLGLRPRDIVREVNGREIKTAAQLAEAAAQKTRWWRFTVERDGRVMKQMLRF